MDKEKAIIKNNVIHTINKLLGEDWFGTDVLLKQMEIFQGNTPRPLLFEDGPGVITEILKNTFFEDLDINKGLGALRAKKLKKNQLLELEKYVKTNIDEGIKEILDGVNIQDQFLN